MYTGAMSSHRILKQEIEEEMLPPQLAEELLRITMQHKKASIPVHLQYRGIDIRVSRYAAARRDSAFAPSDSGSDGQLQANGVDLDQ
jgi:hypothetical protein